MVRVRTVPSGVMKTAERAAGSGRGGSKYTPGKMETQPDPATGAGGDVTPSHVSRAVATARLMAPRAANSEAACWPPAVMDAHRTQSSQR